MPRTIIKDITDGKERAFYKSQNVNFLNVVIDGKEDGESAFKRCTSISLNNCKLTLRYPLWHCNNVEVKNSALSESCRAPLWYCDRIKVVESSLLGVKAFRECNNITLISSNFDSDEIFWNCNKISINSCDIKGVYAFFQSKDISVNKMSFAGKYSFQYAENISIEDAMLDTRDAFWHGKNIIVKNSILKGAYLGWFSENLTLVNCHIIGTQPLCHCKNLKLVNCIMEDCDLAFEYSEVNGNIVGGMASIKNPLSGHIHISRLPMLIQDENDESEGRFSIDNKDIENIVSVTYI